MSRHRFARGGLCLVAKLESTRKKAKDGRADAGRRLKQAFGS